jgi:hypothetical protein
VKGGVRGRHESKSYTTSEEAAHGCATPSQRGMEKRGLTRLRPRDLALPRESESARRVRPPALSPTEGRRHRAGRPVWRLVPPKLEGQDAEPVAARERDKAYRRLLAAADMGVAHLRTEAIRS